MTYRRLRLPGRQFWQMAQKEPALAWDSVEAKPVKFAVPASPERSLCLFTDFRSQHPGSLPVCQRAARPPPWLSASAICPIETSSCWWRSRYRYTFTYSPLAPAIYVSINTSEPASRPPPAGLTYSHRLISSLSHSVSSHFCYHLSISSLRLCKPFKLYVFYFYFEIFSICSIQIFLFSYFPPF